VIGPTARKHDLETPSKNRKDLFHASVRKWMQLGDLNLGFFDLFNHELHAKFLPLLLSTALHHLRSLPRRLDSAAVSLLNSFI